MTQKFLDGGFMQETRRNFLIAAVGAGSCLVEMRRTAMAQQRKPGMPDPPAPAEPQAQDKNAPPQDPTAKHKVTLKRNEKEFRAGVEKLFQMSSELKEEVDKTMTSDVLSVRMYKKMEEIEKLAKELKGKVKG